VACNNLFQVELMRMEYLFLAARNPGYRFFTLRFFTEGGVEFVDQYMDAERAKAVCRELSPKKPKTSAEEVFCEYFAIGDRDPQEALEGIGIVSRIYGKVDTKRMRELEAMLPPGSRQELVLTRDDVARQLSEFYVRDLRDLLRRDLEEDITRALYKHIQLRDDDQLPKYDRNDPETYELAVRAFVEKLLLWVNQVTPAGVSEDIENVLKEHEATSFSVHKRRISLGGGRGYYYWCEHISKYVQLEGYPRGDMVDLSLFPCRRPNYGEQDPGPHVSAPSYIVEPTHD
jgi:hypothetical protein